MYPLRARCAAARVGHRAVCANSAFSVAKKLSTTALSQQFPARLMLPIARGEALAHQANGFELELRRMFAFSIRLPSHRHLLSERFEVSTKSGQLQYPASSASSARSQFHWPAAMMHGCQAGSGRFRSPSAKS